MWAPDYTCTSKKESCQRDLSYNLALKAPLDYSLNNWFMPSELMSLKNSLTLPHTQVISILVLDIYVDMVSGIQVEVPI